MKPRRRAARSKLTIQLARMGDGTFRAELPDRQSVTGSLDEIMELVRTTLPSLPANEVAGEPTETDEEDDGLGMEDDMDYILAKNAELYRRLAQ